MDVVLLMLPGVLAAGVHAVAACWYRSSSICRVRWYMLSSRLQVCDLLFQQVCGYVVVLVVGWCGFRDTLFFGSIEFALQICDSRPIR